MGSREDVVSLDPRRLLVHAVLRGMVRRGHVDTVAEFVAEQERDPAPFAPPTGRAARGVDVTESVADGVLSYRLAPQRGTDRCVVYLHGGAYIGQIGAPQWAFVLDLVRTTGATCVVPIYELAPSGTATQTVSEAAEVVAAAVDEHGPADVVVMGDSAGAGLAVAATRQLRDAGRAMPARLVLLSPWLDVTMSHPDQAAIERRDIMLRRDYLADAGRAYAGHLAADDWRASPLTGDVSGLPPMHVFTGTHDILVTDSRRFVEKVNAAGGEIEYVEAPEMQHVYTIFPLLAESRAARRRIRELLR